MKSSKKIKTLVLLTVLCIVTLLCPLQPTLAYDDGEYDAETKSEPVYSRDQWLYFDRDDHICVCGYTGVDAKITVPSKINGKPVTEISAIEKETNITVFPAKKKETNIYEKDYSFFEDYNKNTTEVVIPEGVLFIGAYAFYKSDIEKITLPKSLLSIGYSAFSFCKSLTSLTIPENVTEIGSHAFSRCGLTEILLPEGLKIIGEYAFMNTPLTHIHIPNTVTNIGCYAFSSAKLEEITLPANLTKVEFGLFEECIALKKACISEGTVHLDGNVFSACPNLEEIYFPSTLRYAEHIFQYNRNLKKIYFAADEEEYKLLFGNSVMDKLTGKSSWPLNVEEYYDSVQIAYNTPVPLAEPSPYPKEPLKLSIGTIILIAAAVICLIMTVIFSVLFKAEKKQTAAIKAEERKKEEEGFHPKVLGAWECKKCGTLNSPIGNFCYKCGRKR